MKPAPLRPQVATTARPPGWSANPTASSDVTTREFCQLLRVCRRTFCTWQALGRIGPQSLSTGGHLKWDRAEVEAWLSSRDHTGKRYDAATWAAVRMGVRAKG